MLYKFICLLYFKNVHLLLNSDNILSACQSLILGLNCRTLLSHITDNAQLVNWSLMDGC